MPLTRDEDIAELLTNARFNASAPDGFQRLRDAGG
jgi:hypothetical protein